MVKRTIRRLRRGVGIPAAALVMCAALATGCSRDDGFDADDGNPVAVIFTATVDGAATPQNSALSGGSRAGAQEFTGTTPAGLPYRDIVDKDGFETRAFYPGAAASSNNVTRGANAPATRTTNGGNQWTTGDKVGIFMLTARGSIGTPANLLADNAELEPTSINTNTASLTPTGGTIYYPQSGNVDFVAYYPYTGTTGTSPGEISGNLYHLTVDRQTDEAAQNDLDVLYSNNATNVAKSRTEPVALTFNHVLSKVTLNVTAGEGFTGTDISALLPSAVSFNGMPLTAALNLQDGSLTAGAAGAFSPVKAATATSPANATFTALLVPQPQDNGATSTGLPNLSGRTVIFTVGGIDYTWAIPDAEVFAAGNHYTYPLTVQSGIVIAGAPFITPWTTGAPHPPGQAEILAVRIKAGTFSMGQAGVAFATPEHEVKLTQDFFMSRHQVTNAQYAAFLNANKIDDSGTGNVTYYEDNFTTPVTETQTFVSTHNWGVTWQTNRWVAQTNYENHPIINVTWYGAKAYADWAGGALPTEAQWEYACRAGSTQEYGMGDDGVQITSDNLGDYAWYEGNSSDGTKAVGQKLPNAYGLYDMHGNVFEWCSDWYEEYRSGLVENPTGPEAGSYRVLRGGGCFNNAQSCRSAYRNPISPAYANYVVGFRVVFVP